MALAVIACLTTAAPAAVTAQDVNSARTGADSLLLPSSVFQVFDSVAITSPAPGVLHLAGVMESGPFRVHVIAADLSRPELSLEAARTGDGLLGRERTSTIAERWQDRARAAGDNATVIAAVNADFFDLGTGEQLAGQVSSARVLKGRAAGDSDVRPKLLVARDGRPYVVRAAYAGALIAGNRHVALDAVNWLPDEASRLVMLDGSWGRDIPSDSLQGGLLAMREAGVRGDTLLLVRSSGPDFRSPGNVLLGASGVARARLNVLKAAGDTLKLVHRFAPVGEGVRTMVGGRPMIVAGGRSLHDANGVFAGAAPAFSTTRHPRTAAGIGRNGSLLLLVTVDGRQDESVGMTLLELAELMLALGAHDALNLDGGGSTAAIVGGRVVNSPSDPGGERTVANALLLVRRGEAGDRARHRTLSPAILHLDASIVRCGRAPITPACGVVLPAPPARLAVTAP
jgi:hypothetical protein